MILLAPVTVYPRPVLEVKSSMNKTVNVNVLTVKLKMIVEIVFVKINAKKERNKTLIPVNVKINAKDKNVAMEKDGLHITANVSKNTEDID